jgi:hypothetical protein
VNAPPTRGSASLELQHVVVTGCQQQAITLQGPGTVFTASSVVFEGNGVPAGNGSESAAAAAAAAAGAAGPQLSLVLAAVDARVELTSVTIRRNSGRRHTRAASDSSWRPFLHPACRDSSVLGGVASSDTSSSSGGDGQHAQHAAQQACGSPLLASSLIDLQSSTLVMRGSRLEGNAADALITARGSSQQALQLLAGTQLHGNSARWLVVADSWAADPVGRRNMMAPQPSEAMPGLDMQPPFTSFDLMGGLRRPDMPAAAAAAGADGRRRRLQQQQQPEEEDATAEEQQVGDAEPPQQQARKQQQYKAPDAVVGKAPRGQVCVCVGGEIELRQHTRTWPRAHSSSTHILACHACVAAPAAAGAAAGQLAAGVHQPQHSAVGAAVAAPRQHQHAGRCHHTQRGHRQQHAQQPGARHRSQSRRQCNRSSRWSSWPAAAWAV